jgi:hypothetical protein
VQRRWVLAGAASAVAIAASAAIGWAAGNSDAPSARAASTRSAAHKHSAGRPPQYLFAHDAQRGTFHPVAGRPGLYELALSGVRPSALYYSDRPNRIVGAVSVGKMLEGLFHKPGESPPNAAINALDSDAQQVLMGAELVSESYDAAKHTLVYTLRRLHQGAVQDRIKGLTDQVLPEHLGRTSVFIDTYWNACQAQVANGTAKTWTLQSATLNNSNDMWGTTKDFQGNTQQTTYDGNIQADLGAPADIPAANDEGNGSITYEDTSGFARGCADTVVWKANDGTLLTISMSDPYSGANAYSCTLSSLDYVCVLNEFSATTGDYLQLVWTICQGVTVAKCTAFAS